MVDSAKDSLARAQKEVDRLRSQLEYETSALQIATDKFSVAVIEHFNHQTETDRLRVHIKDNILYYMQAVWDHEPPDQRFFRLYNIGVPVIMANTKNITVPITNTSSGMSDTFTSVTDLSNQMTAFAEFPGSALTNRSTITIRKLVEVADLDNPLGYKGNYTIFPLKENNYLTYYMMQDYINIDKIVCARDPDEFGNYTIDELEKFMKCLYKKDARVFEKYKDKFKEVIIGKLSSPVKEKDLVIVPTTSLYIEALPGKHPLLEDFKRIHRAIDVKKVQSEVRHAELENIRLGARALKGKYRGSRYREENNHRGQ